MIYVDIDGVLVDSYPIALDAMQQAYREITSGRLLHPKTFRRYFWGQTWEHAVEEMRLDAPTAAAIKERKEHLLAEVEWPIEPLAQAFINSLYDDITFCTAGGEMGARSKLRGLGSLAELPLIYSAPKRDRAFWETRANPALVIDDDDQVIAAAEAAGIHTIHWRIHRRAP